MFKCCDWKEKNTIGRIIRYLGFLVIVLGLLFGISIFFLSMPHSSGFYDPNTMGRMMPPFRNFGLFVIAGTFIHGMLLLGFSEIIFLLDKIAKNKE